jgi:DNA-binding protein HU-beta
VNKAQLIDAVADKLEVSRRTAGDAVDAVLSGVISAVVGGDKVSLTGFGTFESNRRAARTARNPRTGEQVDVPAATVPKFRAGQAFKDEVNGAAGRTAAKKTTKKMAAKKAIKAAAASKATVGKKAATSRAGMTKKAAPTKKTAAAKKSGAAGVTAKQGAPAKKAAPAKKSAARPVGKKSAAKGPANKTSTKKTTTKAATSKSATRKR